MKLTYTVPQNGNYQNVKEVLKAEFLMSDRLLLKLKKLQKISLNKKAVYVHHPIQYGDIISCDLNYEEDNSNIVPTSISLSILYEDEAFLIIDKPSGMPIHPSQDHYLDSLSNGVRFYFDTIGLKKKIRPVNRLDKDTSGIVIFAKNEYLQECLVKQMKSKNFVKKYIAIVNGHLEKKQGTICAPIARKENSIIERCVHPDGDTAITHYKVLSSKDITVSQNFQNRKIPFSQFEHFPYAYDIVECTLETGRTHQIRVHFAYLDHPLLGDTLYGTSSPFINRQALHCYHMIFTHPITKEKISVQAKLPKDIAIFFNKC